VKRTARLERRTAPVASRKENDRARVELIRRRLALSVEKQMNLLCVRLPNSGPAMTSAAPVPAGAASLDL